MKQVIFLILAYTGGMLVERLRNHYKTNNMKNFLEKNEKFIQGMLLGFAIGGVIGILILNLILNHTQNK